MHALLLVKTSEVKLMTIIAHPCLLNDPIQPNQKILELNKTKVKMSILLTTLTPMTYELGSEVMRDKLEALVSYLAS